MRGQADGVFGYVNTIRFSAKLSGIDPDKELRCINYGDYGMDLYSNALIFSKKFVKENPKAVQGFLRAINKAVIDSLKDPKASVAAVLKREPLIKMDVELERFDATIKEEMNHPEIADARPRRHRRRAHEEGDRHPGRRQQAAAHAGDQRNLHARVPAAEGGSADTS